MFVNNVNVAELNPVVSTGTVNSCNIIGISQLRRDVVNVLRYSLNELTDSEFLFFIY
jgi:hypothetical protein